MSNFVVMRGIAFSFAAALLFLSAMPSCSGDGPVVRDFSLGSRLEPDGSIGDDSLIYTLKPFNKKGSNRDLFNHIYFQGDTVCFSLLVSRPVAKGMVKAWFVDPVSGRGYAAERLDVENRRISGFSLAGSLLDDFNRERRDEPVRPDHFCCVPVPFEVRITLADGRGGFSVSKKSSFTVRYEDRNRR